MKASRSNHTEVTPNIFATAKVELLHCTWTWFKTLDYKKKKKKKEANKHYYYDSFNIMEICLNKLLGRKKKKQLM